MNAEPKDYFMDQCLTQYTFAKKPGNVVPDSNLKIALYTHALVLCCFVLCCVVLCCVVLCCVVLCRVVLRCVLLCCAELGLSFPDPLGQLVGNFPGGNVVIATHRAFGGESERIVDTKSEQFRLP